MKNAITLSFKTLLFFVFCVVSVTAQTASPCVKININGPTDELVAGSPVTFSTSYSGGDPNYSATYEWSISAGRISTGQGTSSIIVDTTNIGGQAVTATVEFGGLPPACLRTASSTAFIKVPVAPVMTKKFDEYGKLKWKDEQAKLDKLGAVLMADASSSIYIIFYGGRMGKPGEAEAAAAKVIDYLTNTKFVLAERIFSGNGGYREEQTIEIFVAPFGAAPPQKTPTLDESEVGKPKSKSKT